MSASLFIAAILVALIHVPVFLFPPVEPTTKVKWEDRRRRR